MNTLTACSPTARKPTVTTPLAALFLSTLIIALQPASAAGQPAPAITVSATNACQTIEGFGGSIAFWGCNPDDTALRYALEDLGATIVRLPGQVSESGNPAEYRKVVQNINRIRPNTKMMLSFWQPRSAKLTKRSDWLDTDQTGAYVLKPSMQAAWAAEITSRILTFTREWGANVVAVSVQNEANWSVPGTQTCKWQPDRLAGFIKNTLAPHLATAGITTELATPDLAYVGHNADEAKRFFTTCQTPLVPIFCYHMYDSYANGSTNNAGFDTLQLTQKALGTALHTALPGKRIWMTETTGAQWNSADWHTLGWTAGLDEHGKAIAAARYIHYALVDARCNAFFWWGLVYSQAPDSITDPDHRQKFRDESLVLVNSRETNGTNAFLERTPRYFTFRQFSRFILPGYVRLSVTEGTGLPLVSAFRSANSDQVVVVLVNPALEQARLQLNIAGSSEYSPAETWTTDRSHQCEKTEWTGTLPPESVTTVIYLRR